MNFGIIAFQLNALIPPGLPPQKLPEHLAGMDYSKLVPQVAAHGFNPIELSGDLALFFPQVFSEASVEKLAALKVQLGIEFSVHLPLWSVDPSTPLDEVRRGSVQAVVECVRATRALQPQAYVLHAYGALASEFYRMKLPAAARPLVMGQFQSAARQSLVEILEQTGIESRKLAIETIEFPFDMTLALAEELDLSICFDSGHVLVGFSGAVDLFEALEACLPRLGEVHLHDGPWQGPHHKIGYGKDHQALGKGDLDTGRLLDRLVQAEFQGPLVFELSLPEALESLSLIRELRPGLVAE